MSCCVNVFAGQGQTKASKKRGANGESSSTPQKELKKEGKKSPKRSTSKSSRSSGTPSTETPSSGGREHIEIEERHGSPRLRRGRESEDREEPRYESHVDERDTVMEDRSAEVTVKQIVESPPKPKRTFEVGFIEQEKENVPENVINVSEIKSSPKTPVKMMNGDVEPLTPVHMSDLNHISPQATSTPHPNGTLHTGHRESGAQSSKYII